MTNVLSADYTSEWTPQIAKTLAIDAGFNTRQDFHTYAFEWLPSGITWFIDGKRVRHYAGGSVPVPDLPGKIMMNLWIFGPTADFGGKEIWNNRYPTTAEYDWFRFYQWDGESEYPCAGMGTSCLTADD